MDHSDLSTPIKPTREPGSSAIKLACPAFKDHVMSRLLDWFDSNGWFCIDTIELVYQVSSPGSKLRWFFVDCFAWDKLNGFLNHNTDEIIMFLRDMREFSEDVVRREVEAGTETNLSPVEKKHLYYENPAFNPDA